MFHNYLKMQESEEMATKTFKANNVAYIYKFPSPTQVPVTVSLISFGGGLFGTVSPSGVLTDGDVQAYWKSIGIPTFNQPKVIIQLVGGATNSPVQGQNETNENTIDVTMIGACCPTSNLTIILFIALNSLANFQSLIEKAISPLTIDGIVHNPSIVSISWGSPEIYYTKDQLQSINSTIMNATMKGINFCCSSGDDGSTDGVPGTANYVDFPASCPYVTACGGTNLFCPTLNYGDSTTVETAWSKGGGGVSGTFPKPSWQITLSGAVGSNRCSPDVSLVADPSTGVEFIIGGSNYIFGGTSIVAPAVAAYYACLNTNTFLLPELYSAFQAKPSSFHDITVGSNGAYNAMSGFDLCTGFGSIAGDILTLQLTKPPAIIPVTGITVNAPKTTINIGEKISIVAIVAPTNASNKSVSWSSKNASIATVAETPCPTGVPECSSAGLVTGVSVGSTIIVATSMDGNFQASTTITVTSIPVTIPVTSVTLNVIQANITVGSSYQLIATVKPSNATNKTLIWTSSSNTVTVSNTGLVRGIAVGSSVITVKTVDGGFTAKATITVTNPNIQFSFYPSSVTLYTFSTYKSNLVFYPAQTNVSVVYKSSSPGIADVSSTGIIRTYAPGLAVVTASAFGQSTFLYVYVISSFSYHASKSSIQPIKTRNTFYSEQANATTTFRR